MKSQALAVAQFSWGIPAGNRQVPTSLEGAARRKPDRLLVWRMAVDGEV
jgi:hypothetical protein